MKMKEKHFVQLKTAINSLKLTTSMEEVHNEYIAAGLSDMRFRWDLLHLSKLCPGYGHNDSDWPVYDYLNDTHIDTALRKITNTR